RVTDNALRSPPRQTTSRGNPRHRPGEAVPYGRSEAAPPPSPERRERQLSTAQPPRHPQPVPRARAAAPHGSLGDPEHAHIHEIAWGAHEVSAEHTRADTPRGCAHSGPDLTGG